jgi:hypothetical protein
MEVGLHRVTMQHIRIGNNSYGKVKIFKYMSSLLRNENSIHEEIKHRLKEGNSCYYSVQTLLSSRLPIKNLKIKIYKTNKISSCAIYSKL